MQLRGQNINLLTPVRGNREGDDENGQESDDKDSLDDDIPLAASWKLHPPPTFECHQPLTPVDGNNEENDENGQESDKEYSLDDDIALAEV